MGLQIRKKSNKLLHPVLQGTCTEAEIYMTIFLICTMDNCVLDVANSE